MNADDEKLLQQLGRIARTAERAPEQVQLDKLSAGELPEHELAMLQARSGDDAELSHALAAYEPLPADMTAQIAARVLAIRQEHKNDEPESDAFAAAEDDDLPSGRVVQLHGRPDAGQTRKPSVLWVGLPLSLAAAAMLWFGTNRQPSAGLPAYQLQVSGGEAEVRSAPSAVAVNIGDTNLAPVRVGRDTALHLVLRPETAAASDVSARVYLMSTAHAAVEWPAQIERAPSGALQLVLAPAPAEIDATSGALVVVGDSALIATRGAELATGKARRGDGFQRWRIPLVPGSAR
jgi:hypothetical protein